MPSKTLKQHNLMAMVANDPAKAKELGIKQSVGEEFVQADKGKKFGSERPDLQKVNKQKTDHGKMSMFKKGGTMKTESKKEMREEMKLDTAQDKKLIKRAFAMHDKQEHKGGKGTNLAALKKGGSVKASSMGSVKTSSSRDGIAQRGHTKGRNV